MALLYLTFGFVFSVGFWAKPLVNNATLRLNRADISRSYLMLCLARPLQEVRHLRQKIRSVAKYRPRTAVHLGSQKWLEPCAAHLDATQANAPLYVGCSANPMDPNIATRKCSDHNWLLPKPFHQKSCCQVNRECADEVK